jgi:hypothetical protein
LGRITFRVSRHGEGVGEDDSVEQGGVGVKEGAQRVEVEEGGRAHAVVQLEGGADKE